MHRGCRRLGTGHASPGVGGHKLSPPAFLQAPCEGIAGGLCRQGCARHLLLAYSFRHLMFSHLSVLSLLLSTKLQYPSSHCISPYPCEGLVEASWATRGIGI